MWYPTEQCSVKVSSFLLKLNPHDFVPRDNDKPAETADAEAVRSPLFRRSFAFWESVFVAVAEDDVAVFIGAFEGADEEAVVFAGDAEGLVEKGREEWVCFDEVGKTSL